MRESVLLEVYNSNGQKVSTLINKQLSAGQHIVKWNLADSGLKNGVYFYTLTAGNNRIDGKIILMR